MCFVEGGQLVGADRVGFLRDLSGVGLPFPEKSLLKREQLSRCKLSGDRITGTCPEYIYIIMVD